MAPTGGSSTSISASTRARHSASSAPTEPGRRRRFAPSWTTSARRAGGRRSSGSSRRRIRSPSIGGWATCRASSRSTTSSPAGRRSSTSRTCAAASTTRYQADLIARLDIDPSRKFREYSKGNKQKIGLVIALQHRPDLLMLDEPTSGLDPLDPAGVLHDHPRGEGRGSDDLHVEPHPQRGREDLRSGCDHPRRSTRPRRPRRGAARHGPPPVELRFVDEVPRRNSSRLPGVSATSTPRTTFSACASRAR